MALSRYKVEEGQKKPTHAVLPTVQEARKYHVSIQVLAPGQAPVGVVTLSDPFSDAVRPDQVGRFTSFTFLRAALCTRYYPSRFCVCMCVCICACVCVLGHFAW